MILYCFKEFPETRPCMPCSAFRWVLEAGFGGGPYLSLTHQHKYKDAVWHTSHTRAFGICVNKHFDLGMDHFYYDGPHCSFSLGWLHIYWGGNPFNNFNCNKCDADAGLD